MKEVFAQTLSRGDQHKCVHATVFMYNPQELRYNFLQVRHNLLFYLLRICSLWPYVLTSTEKTKQYASISVAIYNLAIKVFWVKKLQIICCLIKSKSKMYLKHCNISTLLVKKILTNWSFHNANCRAGYSTLEQK